MRRGIRLKHLNPAGKWPSGNVRYYFRPKGQKGVALPDLPPDHPGFLAAYARAAGMKEPPLPKPGTGTIAAAVLAFLASDDFLARAATTRAQWRRGLDFIRKTYGHAMVKDLQARHIEADLSKLRPHPANNRLKVWRAACAWWKERGFIATDPTEGIKRRRIPKTKGHATWTAADVEAFRARWPVGTRERLALELLHWTGARMSDAVKLSEGMIGRDGWLTYTQGKTEGIAGCPVRCPAPAFADPAGQEALLQALEARQDRHAVLMVTAHGAPRSVKAASQWFAAAARAAGIEGKTAHGLRKRRGVILAEGGATEKQIAAWLGHESLAMVQHYTRETDLKRTIAGTLAEQESSNFPAEVPRMAGK